jgi:hypothetical protein
MKLDEELDRLYGLPLAEFTGARNELARELLNAGEREAADEVKLLRKPSLSAWTVNQLARKERLQVRSLMTAAERLRNAQAKLLRGGSREELQEAVQRHREVVGALLNSAKEVLRSAGHPATDATLERIRETLTAVAGHDEGMKLVEEGRLSEDLDPAGFGPVTESAPSGGKRTAAPPASQRKESERKRRIDEAKQEVDQLRAEIAERKARARDATSEARRAERAAEAAKKAAEREAAELEQLTARLEAAKDALESSRGRS